MSLNYNFRLCGRIEGVDFEETLPNEFGCLNRLGLRTLIFIVICILKLKGRSIIVLSFAIKMISSDYIFTCTSSGGLGSMGFKEAISFLVSLFSPIFSRFWKLFLVFGPYFQAKCPNSKNI